jgi:hypothetical protein
VDELDELSADAGALRRINVLYLVAALEGAIDLGGVAWTTEDAALVSRLANLMAALHGQIEGRR